ncbi:MAG: hypothetical protein IJE08_02610 [Clostridia bacterium]|nr:hypothetical protein [Clostridia bacterium]
MDKYFAWFGLKGSLVLTALLSLSALLAAVLFPSQARLLCFLAMLMSSAGDVFLMRFPGIVRRVPNFFAVGAGCFMLAHLLYTACFGLKIRSAGHAFLNGGVVIALVIAAVCLICFTAACKNRSQLPLAIAYLLVIMVNCATVFSYAWGSGAGSLAGWSAAVGAACFLASDLVIGLGLLVNVHRYDDLIWWLYPIGQALLILGAGR